MALTKESQKPGIDQMMVPLTIPISASKYQILQKLALKKNQDIVTFVKSPPVLECYECPCGNRENNTCSAVIDGTCLEEFYKFLFFRPDEAPHWDDPTDAAK